MHINLLFQFSTLFFNTTTDFSHDKRLWKIQGLNFKLSKTMRNISWNCVTLLDFGIKRNYIDSAVFQFFTAGTLLLYKLVTVKIFISRISHYHFLISLYLSLFSILISSYIKSRQNRRWVHWIRKFQTKRWIREFVTSRIKCGIQVKIKYCL